MEGEDTGMGWKQEDKTDELTDVVQNMKPAAGEKFQNLIISSHTIRSILGQFLKKIQDLNDKYRKIQDLQDTK